MLNRRTIRIAPVHNSFISTFQKYQVFQNQISSFDLLKFKFEREVLD